MGRIKRSVKYLRYTFLRCRECRKLSRMRSNRVWCSDECWYRHKDYLGIES